VKKFSSAKFIIRTGWLFNLESVVLRICGCVALVTLCLACGPGLALAGNAVGVISQGHTNRFSFSSLSAVADNISMPVPAHLHSRVGQQIGSKIGSVTIEHVKISKKARNSILSLSSDLKDKSVMLRIEGIELPSDGPLKVRVFLNAPAADAATPLNDPSYAGTFTLVPLGGERDDASDKESANLFVNVTKIIGDILRQGTKLSVTLVPVEIAADRPVTSKLSVRGASIHIPGQ
jgi:Protein of unknown function (DUF_B2219)